MRSLMIIALVIMASACDRPTQKEITVPADIYARSPDKTFRLSDDQRTRLSFAFDADALEELFRRYPAERREAAIKEFVLMAEQVTSGAIVITDMRSVESGNAEVDVLLKRALSKHVRSDVRAQ